MRRADKWVNAAAAALTQRVCHYGSASGVRPGMNQQNKRAARRLMRRSALNRNEQILPYFRLHFYIYHLKYWANLVRFHHLWIYGALYLNKVAMLVVCFEFINNENN
jgi:hypothetical protein